MQRSPRLAALVIVLALPSARAEALPGPPSAQAALSYLRAAMDQYHDRFPVYDEVSSGGNHFHSWAKILPGGVDPGSDTSVSMNGSWTDDRHTGATAIRGEFQDIAGPNFGGFYLLNGVLAGSDTSPSPNFGDIPNAGIDLTGAVTLTFWARGQNGGEVVEFLMGGVGWNPATGEPVKPFPDSTPVVKVTLTLTTAWTKYALDLAGKDLSYVLGGFGWVASDALNPGGAVFFLDDIQYDLGAAARAARLDEPRFIKSFITEPYQSLPAPLGIFDLYHRNAAYTYDNALALLAFLADGSADSLRRAKLIGDALVYAAEHDRTYTDGRLRDVYAAGDLALPPGWTPGGKSGTVAIPGYYVEAEKKFHEIGQEGISTGNVAWALIALAALYERTQDGGYLTAATALGDFIRTFRHDTGTYRGFQGGLTNPEGPAPVSRTWASTEHNLDIYAGFTLLARLTGDSSWASDAEHARQFVEAMWDGGLGCELAGTLDPETRNQNPDELPLDVQPWMVLAIPGALVAHPGLLDCAEQRHRTEHAGFSGFDFNTDKDGVWFEGTAQMAVAYDAAGKAALADALRITLADAQGTSPFGDGSAVAAATLDGLTTGFDSFYFVRRHLGASAWNVFAQLRFNPFYGFPLDGKGDLFTVAPCRLLDTRQPGQGPALTSGGRRVVQVSGLCGIPATAVAVAFNLTAIGPSGDGFLTLHPGNLPAPVASTITFSAGRTLSNNGIVRLSTERHGTVAVLPFVGAGGTVHMALDVTGYFE